MARLIPVFSLHHDLLYDQINKVIRIIHESGGFVFLVMSHNLKANIPCFNKFHSDFGSFSTFSVNHPFKNKVFEFLFLLFDTVHLFKNIKNNWLTEKMKKLRYTNFETGEELAA